MVGIRSVAVIGGGASGLASVKALVDEQAFDRIVVFERRNAVGGIWIFDEHGDEFPLLSTSKAPERFFNKSPIYPGLYTNVPAELMSFSWKQFPEVRSEHSITLFGEEHPFRSHKTVRSYLEELWEPYLGYLQLNTSISNAEKVDGTWVLSLSEKDKDGSIVSYKEEFDAVIVATGCYDRPYIPDIPGLGDFQAAFPNKLVHAKGFRGAAEFKNKKVLQIGGNISGADIIREIRTVVNQPLYLSLRSDDSGQTEGIKGPGLARLGQIEKVTNENGGTFHFKDGSVHSGFDKVVFATGYIYNYPFLPDIKPGPHIPHLFQHIFKVEDPTLAFVGVAKSAISFKIFEYQAVVVAGLFAGKVQLPDTETQKKWESDRLEIVPISKFHLVAPNFKPYWADIFKLLEPVNQVRNLPPYDDKWDKILESAFEIKFRHWNNYTERSNI